MALSSELNYVLIIMYKQLNFYYTLVRDNEDTIKVIIELLNAGDYNTQELYDLLKIKQRDQKNISEIIINIWPEMVTDRARHNLCEALIKNDVRPYIICEQIYMPWVCKITFLKLNRIHFLK